MNLRKMPQNLGIILCRQAQSIGNDAIVLVEKKLKGNISAKKTASFKNK